MRPLRKKQKTIATPGARLQNDNEIAANTLNNLGQLDWSS